MSIMNKIFHVFRLISKDFNVKMCGESWRVGPFLKAGTETIVPYWPLLSPTVPYCLPLFYSIKDQIKYYSYTVSHYYLAVSHNFILLSPIIFKVLSSTNNHISTVSPIIVIHHQQPQL